MEYSIKKLASLAGISTRTLRYYDEIGLLKPVRINSSGYRIYGEHEVNLLQQILFYKERGFELKQIEKILYSHDFDLVKAMEEHLKELEMQQARTALLIETLEKTLQALKGEHDMSNKEKFRAFKEKIVKDNETNYGAEARKKYGNEEVDASNKKMMNMSEEDFEEFKNLETEILHRLEKSVAEHISPDSEAAKEIVELHKRWLSMTWKTYSTYAHKGVGAMYVADERFTAYYDKNVAGCAQFLKDSIDFWIA